MVLPTTIYLGVRIDVEFSCGPVRARGARIVPFAEVTLKMRSKAGR
jgi:hypothetical protein